MKLSSVQECRDMLVWFVVLAWYELYAQAYTAHLALPRKLVVILAKPV
jgi:hypothetical protein